MHDIQNLYTHSSIWKWFSILQKCTYTFKNWTRNGKYLVWLPMLYLSWIIYKVKWMKMSIVLTKIENIFGVVVVVVCLFSISREKKKLLNNENRILFSMMIRYFVANIFPLNYQANAWHQLNGYWNTTTDRLPLFFQKRIYSLNRMIAFSFCICKLSIRSIKQLMPYVYYSIANLFFFSNKFKKQKQQQKTTWNFSTSNRTYLVNQKGNCQFTWTLDGKLFSSNTLNQCV